MVFNQAQTWLLLSFKYLEYKHERMKGCFIRKCNHHMNWPPVKILIVKLNGHWKKNGMVFFCTKLEPFSCLCKACHKAAIIWQKGVCAKFQIFIFFFHFKVFEVKIFSWPTLSGAQASVFKKTEATRIKLHNFTGN